MSKVLIYNKATGAPVEYLKSANTALFSGRDDVIINPAPALLEKPFKYLKVVAGVLMEKAAAEKTDADQAEAAASVNPFDALVARVAAIELEIKELKKPK